jgi:hypothetical protein
MNTPSEIAAKRGKTVDGDSRLRFAMADKTLKVTLIKSLIGPSRITGRPSRGLDCVSINHTALLLRTRRRFAA